MPAYHFQRVEAKWQRYWDEHKTFQARDLAPGQPKMYVLDMFPYPSGAGLHVGHPEGYTATDILCRYRRMKGYNVLHPMGWDAFGLPAEQYAVQTNTHPRITTQKNIANFRRQIKALGFSYDWDREVDTTDPGYYRWTQWIFLQIFNTWYDPDFEWIDPQGKTRKGRGRPIEELPIPEGVEDAEAYRDSKRLAYRAEVPVNWCPALGTVLANEEVIDGKSERGSHPVIRMPLKQWMLRITAYADRLVEDLDGLDWPRAIKDMQRNWVGRSEGAEVDFPVFGLGELGREPENMIGGDKDAGLVGLRPGSFPESPDENTIRVYTTRPDTLFGASYMVLAPEHPLVDRIATPERRSEVAAYREASARKSDLDRTDLAKTKTGVFTGAHAINPVNGHKIPIWIADYVLMGYGTGAIMAVPGHDERDFEFARKFDLPIFRVVASSADKGAEPLEQAESEAGIAVNSRNASLSLDGLPTSEAKVLITEWLSEHGLGRKTSNYKLRDWLFSRQRYWGEPFPVVIDEQDRAHALPESELPVLLPELDDFQPTGTPEGPLSKATEWVNYKPGLRRETNTMPQWAGSCWYYLRYLDPKNTERPWDPQKERDWMPVDLYVGGAEHAVLHLLYSRFWHKVLFDRGHVSTAEPFQRLVNQGMILGEMEYTGYKDVDGKWYEPDLVRTVDDGGTVRWFAGDVPVYRRTISESSVTKKGEMLQFAEFANSASGDSTEVEVPASFFEARAHKMSKSRGNIINPDKVIEEYGADSLRLYEMFMGPLEAVKPWSMKGVEGVYRFLGRAWRMIVDTDAEELRLDRRVVPIEPTKEQAKIVARTIKGVTDDLEGMRFNTAISKLMEFTNAFTAMETRPISAMEKFVLLLAPFAPHVAEELWEMLGNQQSLAYEEWPKLSVTLSPSSISSTSSVGTPSVRVTYDESLLKDEEIEIPVQVNGKLKAKVVVPAEADRGDLERAAMTDGKIAALIEGKKVVKIIVVPGKLVNIVIAG